MVTQEELKARLSYNKVSGVFTWLKRRVNRGCSGTVAGGPAGIGYRRIMVNGTNHKEHRLAWLFCYGELPVVIDHINGKRSDNRIVNLRSVSPIDNQRNMKVYSTNTSGVVGVRMDAQKGMWHSRINVKSKSVHLGFFKDKCNAIAARKEAEIKYGFHKNHGRLK